jgi:endonuclease III-like uncharacterized protein
LDAAIVRRKSITKKVNAPQRRITVAARQSAAVDKALRLTKDMKMTEQEALMDKNDEELLSAIKKHAPFYAHTAYAYPKLVDALKNVLRSDEFKMVAEIEARKLLKELGEAIK